MAFQQASELKLCRVSRESDQVTDQVSDQVGRLIVAIGSMTLPGELKLGKT